MSLLHALQNTTQQHESPYRHWIVDQPLDDGMLTEVGKTRVGSGGWAYDGTRASDNGGGGINEKLRCYIEKDNVEHFPGLARLIDQLLAPDTISYFEHILRCDLVGTYLRMEVISDRQGFWLKPHKDIKEKLMSFLIYANPWNESEDLGTDIYDADLNVVKTIPYRDNIGYLFAPGDNTWHGLEKKQIVQERRSLLVNYVTFETDWKLPERPQVRRAA